MRAESDCELVGVQQSDECGKVAAVVAGVGVGEVGLDGGVLVAGEVEQCQLRRLRVGGTVENDCAAGREFGDGAGQVAPTHAVEYDIELSAGARGGGSSLFDFQWLAATDCQRQ